MITAITGASGHIGANLIRGLLQEEKPIRALVHNHRDAFEGLNIEKVRADVTDIDSLIPAFQGADVVYHLAGAISLEMNDWPKMEAINVKGTHNVVEACLRCGVRRLVHFSSIHAVVQEPFDKPVDELRPLGDSADRPPYDRSKALSEREVRQGIEQGLDAIILNPTAVIGPYDYQLSHLGEALLIMAQGRMPALIKGGFDWVDVRDVVNGAIRAEAQAPIGAKYLFSGHWASIQDLAKLTEEIMGVPAPRFVCPTWLALTSAPAVTLYNQITRSRQLYNRFSIKTLSACNHRVSHDRATRELNYQPRPLRDTLADTFRWFQTSGMLEQPKITKTASLKR